VKIGDYLIFIMKTKNDVESDKSGKDSLAHKKIITKKTSLLRKSKLDGGTMNARKQSQRKKPNLRSFNLRKT